MKIQLVSGLEIDDVQRTIFNLSRFGLCTSAAILDTILAGWVFEKCGIVDRGESASLNLIFNKAASVHKPKRETKICTP